MSLPLPASRAIASRAQRAPAPPSPSATVCRCRMRWMAPRRTSAAVAPSLSGRPPGCCDSRRGGAATSVQRRGACPPTGPVVQPTHPMPRMRAGTAPPAHTLCRYIPLRGSDHVEELIVHDRHWLPVPPLYRQPPHVARSEHPLVTLKFTARQATVWRAQLSRGQAGPATSGAFGIPVPRLRQAPYRASRSPLPEAARPAPQPRAAPSLRRSTPSG